MSVDKEQKAFYVECVTGTNSSKPNDVASYLYRINYDISTYIEQLRCPEHSLSYKIALNKLISLNESILINAKYFEGVPIQQSLF